MSLTLRNDYFLGLCGRNKPTPCKLAWSKQFSTKVGLYPSALLPSKRTQWFSSAGSTFSFRAPIISPGNPALPSLGIFSSYGLGTTQFDTFNSQSHFTIIFAKTANRLNKKYVLKESDFLTYDAESQTIEIDVGEYVFEALAVTDRNDVVPEKFDLKVYCPTSITQSTRDRKGANVTYTIHTSGGKGNKIIETSIRSGSLFPVGKTNVQVTVKDEEETTVSCDFDIIVVLDTDDYKLVDDPFDSATEEDILFRRLFDLEIPEEKNRFREVVIDRRSLEYRLDNGRSRTVDILDNSGQGDLNSPSYRDASSKRLKIDVSQLRMASDSEQTAGEIDRPLKAGDTLYLTYIGVLQHYLRQRVNITWAITAMSIPPTAQGYVVEIKVSNFRFFEWNLDKQFPDDQNEKVVTIGGWRVVETFNAKPQHIALVNDKYIGDFCYGSRSGIQNIEYMPGSTYASELDDYIYGRKAFPVYQVNFNSEFDGANYSDNIGNPQEYRNTKWSSRAIPNNNYKNNIEHILYNVHPKALKKRDIDKWGIERFFAQEVEKDIQEGRITSVPFMDDAGINDPTSSYNEYLNQSNCLFAPVLPISRYSSSNAEIDAGVGGGILIGEVGNSEQVFGYMTFKSNLITEFFDKETRILVERHFTNAQKGDGIVAIEGAPTSKLITTSCILDPSRTYSFCFHSDVNNYIVFNYFRNGDVESGMNSLDFRPDLGYPDTSQNNPSPDDYERLIGWSGMLGDVSGYYPGKKVTTTAFLAQSTFQYFTNNRELFIRRGMPFTQMVDISSITIENDTLSIPLPLGHYGRIEMVFEMNEDISRSPIQVNLKSSGSIVGVIDTVYLWSSGVNVNNDLQIDMKWFYCDRIEIRGEAITKIKGIPNIAVVRLSAEYDNDFTRGNGDTKKRTDDDRITERPAFMMSDAVTIAEDEKSVLYLFFSDKDGGISCAVSRDFGHNWQYYYGIVEKMASEQVYYPFVITSFEGNRCFLFFMYLNKIFCKSIDYNKFEENDACVYEKTEDIYKINDDGLTATENESVYTDKGKDLRRHTLSYICAGNIIDEGFTTILDRIEVTGEDGSVHAYPKYPFAKSSGTVIPYQDIDTPYFSAYRNDQGVTRLFFLGPTNGDNLLQVFISTDNCSTWYDLLEYAQNGSQRIKSDKNKQTLFIDRQDRYTNVSEGDDPYQSDQGFVYGINVHKKKGELEKNNVYEISSPYLFCQTSFGRVFLFYVFEGCLLCKIFHDSLFEKSLSEIKETIEDNLMAYFVDGDLTTLSSDLYSESDSEGNVIFQSQYASGIFSLDRSINPQRVSACELPNGNVRVFYKHAKSDRLHAAIFNGIWMPEDMMKDPKKVGKWNG